MIGRKFWVRQEKLDPKTPNEVKIKKTNGGGLKTFEELWAANLVREGELHYYMVVAFIFQKRNTGFDLSDPIFQTSSLVNLILDFISVSQNTEFFPPQSTTRFVVVLLAPPDEVWQGTFPIFEISLSGHLIP